MRKDLNYFSLYCCYFILNKRKRDTACCRQKAACQMMVQVLALNFWSLSITCQLRHHEVSCGFHSDSNHCSVKLTWLTAKSRRTSENSSAKNPANLLRPQTRIEMTTRVISFDTNPNNYSIICTLTKGGIPMLPQITRKPLTQKEKYFNFQNNNVSSLCV